MFYPSCCRNRFHEDCIQSGMNRTWPRLTEWSCHTHISLARVERFNFGLEICSKTGQLHPIIPGWSHEIDINWITVGEKYMTSVWHCEIIITSFHRLHVWFYCEQFTPVYDISVTRWNYYHLVSPFTRLILLWTIHPCIISKLLLKLFNHLIYFNYVSSRIPCIGQWCFCCISCNSSLNGYGDSNICFDRIYIWSFHLFTKSSLCVGDLLRHHTPHLRVTHFRWPVPYKGWCPLASLSEARWMVERGWLCSIF